MTRILMPVSAHAHSARALLYLGGAVWFAAALAGLWELVASQAPGTPLYLGVLPGPIERLRREAFDVGVVLLVASLLLGERDLPRRVLGWLFAGVVLVLAAGLYAAATGMTGVQMSDLRPDASWVFVGKLVGRVLLAMGALGVGLRVVERR